MVERSSASLIENKSGAHRHVILDSRRLPVALVQAQSAVDARDWPQARSLLSGSGLAEAERFLQAEATRIDIPYLVGRLYRSLGSAADAERWFQRALQSERHPLILQELASLYRATGHPTQAAQYRREALAKAPEDSDIRLACGLDLLRIGQIREGLDLLRDVVDSDPTHADAYSKWLFHAQYLPEIDPEELAHEHRRWGQRHAPLHRARTRHVRGRDPHRRLRVGYLSPDFCRHSVAYTFEPILAGHDRTTVEVFGYGNVESPDDVTERLTDLFDRYLDITRWDDREAAERIDRDEIDILVNLAGHVGGHRIGVLAYKPAPIQVDWGGQATLGLPQVEYRLTDRYLDPPETQRLYTERFVPLPSGFHIYAPQSDAPAVSDLPAARTGVVTFGSFNNRVKINDATLGLWAQVLQEVPHARLLLKFQGGNDRTVQQGLRQHLDRYGIAPERIGIIGFVPRREAMALYGEVDIGLDPYPFNGCATTLESLWMGVPVVTLVGPRPVARAGLSLLAPLGLSLCVAHRPEAYVAKAKALADNLPALARLRAGLRQRVVTSSLCDTSNHVREIEASYRTMWQTWCRASHD
ncbi:hypothetical protein ACFL6U_01685 [Planctomycetota bacterium]